MIRYIGALVVATDVQIYADCMARIRHRIDIVQTIVSGGIRIGHADQTAELIFVQFRKTLEEIAFASLSANKEKYSEVYANFSKHWRVKDMLVVMDTVNPNFYPVPLPAPVEIAPGRPGSRGALIDSQKKRCTGGMGCIPGRINSWCWTNPNYLDIPPSFRGWP